MEWIIFIHTSHSHLGALAEVMNATWPVPCSMVNYQPVCVSGSLVVVSAATLSEPQPSPSSSPPCYLLASAYADDFSYSFFFASHPYSPAPVPLIFPSCSLPSFLFNISSYFFSYSYSHYLFIHLFFPYHNFEHTKAGSFGRSR